MLTLPSLFSSMCITVQTNTKLCDRFSIGHFPMLLWGPPAEFASSNFEPKNNKSKIQAIDDARTADRLLNWINKQIGRHALLKWFLLLFFSAFICFIDIVLVWNASGQIKNGRDIFL